MGWLVTAVETVRAMLVTPPREWPGLVREMAAVHPSSSTAVHTDTEKR